MQALPDFRKPVKGQKQDKYSSESDLDVICKVRIQSAKKSKSEDEEVGHLRVLNTEILSM